MSFCNLYYGRAAYLLDVAKPMFKNLASLSNHPSLLNLYQERMANLPEIDGTGYRAKNVRAAKLSQMLNVISEVVATVNNDITATSEKAAQQQKYLSYTDAAIKTLEDSDLYTADRDVVSAFLETSVLLDKLSNHQNTYGKPIIINIEPMGFSSTLVSMLFKDEIMNIPSNVYHANKLRLMGLPKFPEKVFTA